MKASCLLSRECRAEDECWLQIKLSAVSNRLTERSPNPALSSNGKGCAPDTRVRRPGPPGSSRRAQRPVRWPTSAPQGQETNRNTCPPPTALGTTDTHTIFWWRKGSGHSITSCSEKEFDKNHTRQSKIQLKQHTLFTFVFKRIYAGHLPLRFFSW